MKRVKKIMKALREIANRRERLKLLPGLEVQYEASGLSLDPFKVAIPIREKVEIRFNGYPVLIALSFLGKKRVDVYEPGVWEEEIMKKYQSIFS